MTYMGDMADFITQNWDFDENEFSPADFLDMTDDQLKKDTAATRCPKLMGIRKWPNPLSQKQRYCLALWLYNQEFS